MEMSQTVPRVGVLSHSNSPFSSPSGTPREISGTSGPTSPRDKGFLQSPRICIDSDTENHTRLHTINIDFKTSQIRSVSFDENDTETDKSKTTTLTTRKTDTNTRSGTSNTRDTLSNNLSNQIDNHENDYCKIRNIFSMFWIFRSFQSFKIFENLKFGNWFLILWYQVSNDNSNEKQIESQTQTQSN